MTTERPGRRALVTGATRGIGKATAVALGDSGWDVAILGRTRHAGEGRDDSDTGGGRPLPGSLEETAAVLRGSGAEAIELAADLHDHRALEDAVATVVDSWGGLDLLVNNAVDTGPGSMVAFLDLTTEQLQAKLDANAVSPFVMIKAVLPTMLRDGGGTIVNVIVPHGHRRPTRAGRRGRLGRGLRRLQSGRPPVGPPSGHRAG